MVHQSVSRGLAVFADAWLLGWLAEISADLRENGSAVEVVSRRCAIQIHDFYVTSRPGQLSLAIPLWVGAMSTRLDPGSLPQQDAGTLHSLTNVK